MLRGIFFSLIVAGIAAASGAMAQRADPYSDSERAARACAGMGLNPSEAPYVFCKMSLQESAAAASQARDIGAPTSGEDQFGSYQRGDQTTSVRRACVHVGLAPGSLNYASCVGNLNMTIDDSNMVGSD
jgi:hypothetical protein